MKKVKFSNDIIKIKLKIISVIIIICFGYIIYKLIDINYFNNQEYFVKLSIKENKTYVNKYAKRGKILDRNGNVLVDNKTIYTINYRKKSNISQSKELEIIKEVVEFLDLDYENITNEILKEYFYITNYDVLNSRANENIKRMYKERSFTRLEYENYLKKLITDSDLDLLTDKDKKISYLYSLMNDGYRNDIKEIKDDISNEEASKISEYFDYGFEIGVTYKRIYPYGDVFRNYLGNLGSIPADEIDEYLEKGYRRNDEVGVSYLEKQYESILKGQNEEYTLTASGEKIITQDIKDGEDIYLTIDINLQKDIENIIYKQVVSAKREMGTKYFNKSYVIISNPNTGEIYASAGVGVLNNRNYSRVNYLTDLTNYNITPGSIVKGASHLAGYKYGAIKIGTIVNDGCIKIKNTPKKCSWKRLGRLNDLTALKYSSNYYQFLIAIKLGEGNYKYNAGLKLNVEGFKKYREIYNQFGLGVKTGLDLPNESIGYVGKDTYEAALLDYPIGQYETYTPMQLMQYINTLATGGKRYALHYLKDYEPKILNYIDVEDKYIKRVQEGLKMVMETGGTGKSHINTKYKAAGKTGTAQSFIDTNLDGKIDTETISYSFGAYMPYDNSKVSIVVLSPNVSDGKSSHRSRVNRKITQEVTKLYFDKYNKN